MAIYQMGFIALCNIYLVNPTNLCSSQKTATESCLLSTSWGFLGLRLIWQDIDDAGQSQRVKLCALVYGPVITQTLCAPTLKIHQKKFTRGKEQLHGL